MGNTLYLECASGISGDMTVAALIDLGVYEKKLVEALHSLPLDGYEIEISRVKKSGLDACDFQVKLEHENHDHDMAYLHGHEHEHGDEHEHAHEHMHEHVSDHEDGHGYEHGDEHVHDHGHGHEHGHDHTHGHGHEHTHEHGHEYTHEHGHEHRGLAEIQSIITQSQMSERAKRTALRIFEILAEAESKAHGVSIDQVHFHEVGAVDSIVDIAAAAICLDELDITEAIVPSLHEGHGSIRCQHGILPVPVPAVLNIIQANHLTLHPIDVEGELVTPTGAAIAAAVKTADQLPQQYQIDRIGIGAGKRTYERPSLLRAMLIHEDTTADTIYRLESNIDDCSGEALGYCMERLLEAGARDAFYTPIFMKKNRPAYQLNVICTKDLISRMEQIIFEETTTIGIRRMELERTVLPREKRTVETSLGLAEVKVCTLPNGEKRVYPEYDSVRRLAREKGTSFQAAFDAVKDAADVLLQAPCR